MSSAKRFSLFLVPLLALLSSCDFINWIDSKSGPNQALLNLKDAQSFSIVFSGNINGETHPCGCRHFPLGGLPQVAGALNDIASKRPVLYVDTGDALFTSSKIPQSLSSSLSYNAQELAQALKKIGLSFMTPGDQDFAQGSKFLADIKDKTQIEFMIANLAPDAPFKATAWTKFEIGEHKLFLTGIVNPDVFLGEERALFTDPAVRFDQVLAEMKASGYDEKSPTHRLVVLSHSGMDFDINFAKRFAMIDWILGAHSQSFNKIPYGEGKTNLVQVLSRNHYLGEIQFSLTTTKADDKYRLVEMRDEVAQKLDPNPWTGFIDSHKAQMSKLQQAEQEKFFKLTNHSETKYKTAASCIECHAPQAQKWQSTAHSIAFHTLVQAGEENNLSCVGCHALGTSEPRGFMKTSDIVTFEAPSEKDVPKADPAQYWAEVKKALAPIESVRALKASRLKEYSDKWLAIDAKFGVSHNFANVQCLNCHEQAGDHPFDVGSSQLSKSAKLENIKSKCLNCHDPDQSPEWYSKDEAGQVSGPNQAVVDAHIKDIACPAN